MLKQNFIISSLILFALLILFTSSCGDRERDNKSAKFVTYFREYQKINITDFSSPGRIESIATFISPACEHCQYQTQALLSDHEHKPEGLRLAFLSDIHPDSLKAYASQFDYDTATTVFLWDEGGKIAQQMEVSSYPTMFLYDTAGVHLQTIVGEAKPGYVYKYFHATH